MNVTFNWIKYNNKPHWVHQTVFLGEDVHGFWFKQHQGSRSYRPGLSYVTETDVTLLVSRSGDWVAKFFPPDRDDLMKVYVDIATAVAWNPELNEVTGVDMDLDVIQLSTGKTWIEDEDEFDIHQKLYSYPEPLISHTSATAKKVFDSVLHAHAPFNEETLNQWEKV